MATLAQRDPVARAFTCKVLILTPHIAAISALLKPCSIIAGMLANLSSVSLFITCPRFSKRSRRSLT